MKNLIALTFAVVLFTACSNNKSAKESSSEGASTEIVTPQFYEYQRAFTKLTWTAYKTTAKLGVSGTFNTFEIAPGVSYGTLTTLMDHLEFTIPVASTNSENEERDGKIVATFFGSMMATENITGLFTSVAGNDSAGTVQIKVKMNDIEHEIEGTYTATGNKVIIKTSLHLGDWKAEPSISALNEVCNDLHKGEDGVSKLWPDVDIVIESSLKPVSNSM
ncbi:MAG: polyisoprenoid-binding protein YceI [Bacteroidia bacterium]|jgi:polyisoprenoid-binding protein YceI